MNKLVIGRQLIVNHGDVQTGNAIIVGIWPLGTGANKTNFMEYQLVTDYGDVLIMEEADLKENYKLGHYVSDITEYFKHQVLQANKNIILFGEAE